MDSSTPMTTITTAVTTGLQSVQSDALDLIASVLPYALALMGAFLVISLGIKAFRKFTGR